MVTKYRRVAGTVRIAKDGEIDRNLPGSTSVKPEHQPIVEKLLKMFMSQSKSFMPGDEYYTTARPFMPRGSNLIRYAIRLGSYLVVGRDVRKSDNKFNWYLDWYQETKESHPSILGEQEECGLNYSYLDALHDVSLSILERARDEGMQLLQAAKEYDWRSLLYRAKCLNRK